MQTIRGTIDTPLSVSSSLAIHGLVYGPICIESSGSLVLHGMCESDVVVEAGGKAELWGVIKGNVINRGGDVHVFGIVDGWIARIAGSTAVSNDSLIRGGFAP